jgi:hypothetical protein
VNLFGRKLRGVLLDRFFDLLDTLAPFNISINKDTMIWTWSSTGIIMTLVRLTNQEIALIK